MSDQDYYKLLGLRFDATPDEVRAAYRKIARTHHPDVATSDKDKELFHKAAEAYSILADLNKRNAYNKSHGFPFVEFLDNRGEESPSAQETRPQPESNEPGKIRAGLDNSKGMWSRLQKGRAEGAQRVTDKLASVDPNELKQPTEPEVAAWGESDEKSPKPSSGKSLFGFLRRGRSDRNIEELKRYQESILRANNVAPVTEESWQPDQSRRYQPEEQEASKSAAATIEERVFQFRITSYEAFLGTLRQIALPSSDPSGFTRLNVKIPKNIQNGTRLQISRGWERASVRVEVVEDRFYRVAGNDIWLFAPVLFNEAYFGISFLALGAESRTRVTLPGKETFLGQQILAGQGLPFADGGRGELYVQPYVVPASLSIDQLPESLQREDPATKTLVEQSRSSTAPRCGETKVRVVNVTLHELVAGGQIRFQAEQPDSFFLPAKWSGGILSTSGGEEVIPFLVLPSAAGMKDSLQSFAEKVREMSLRDVRDEMVS